MDYVIYVCVRYVGFGYDMHGNDTKSLCLCECVVKLVWLRNGNFIFRRLCGVKMKLYYVL